MQQYRYYNNNFKYSKFLQLSLSLSLSLSFPFSLFLLNFARSIYYSWKQWKLLARMWNLTCLAVLTGACKYVRTSRTVDFRSIFEARLAQTRHERANSERSMRKNSIIFSKRPTAVRHQTVTPYLADPRSAIMTHVFLRVERSEPVATL